MVGVPMLNVFVFSLTDGVGRAFSTATSPTVLANEEAAAEDGGVSGRGSVVIDDSDATSNKRQRIDVEGVEEIL
jgi:hypothetical protein